ncbi:MAG: DUF4249 family protein [Bacteroidales bacterium]|nr:DUF4249 family protein [Bacteroidales bacterium]
MNKIHTLLIAIVIVAFFTSCKVDFSPNAPWRDLPSIYCVIDPEEDTVWARVQRCYLGEDNLYNYAPIADSNYYAPNDISVHLLVWKGQLENGVTLVPSTQLLRRWELTYTERPGKPEGNFPSGMQPLYYCVPGSRQLTHDTGCVFQIIVVSNSTGETLASATTTLVGFLDKTIRGRDSTEAVLVLPSSARAQEFGFRVGSRGSIKWNTIPRGRYYQPIVTFYYRKGNDTLSIDITGTPLPNTNNASQLTSKSITSERFYSVIKNHLRNNTDTLYFVNNVDVTILACNEDLKAYITSQGINATTGQEYNTYSNIEGGVGIFGSRRTHIRVNVPSDSVGTPSAQYIPFELKNLGVGFYGFFSK